MTNKSKTPEKILIISNNNDFSSMLAQIVVVNFLPSPEIKICPLSQGRDYIKHFMPQIIVVDADTVPAISITDYLIGLLPKYARPVIVCTEVHHMKFHIMNAGAMEVIYKHGKDSEHFTNRLCSSIHRLMEHVKTPQKITGSPYQPQTKVIAIGGSTGSTQAMPKIIEKLDKTNIEIPPIVAVLHMPVGYTEIFAEQLDKSTRFRVVEAQSGMYLEPNKIIVAAGGKHLRVFKDKKGYFITSESGVRISGHCPSVNVLFDSVAYTVKNNAVGVILTGMGNDGATGMNNMHKMGAFNIGQDEESSVVYGMPRAAFELGAVSKRCSLDRIADEIVLAINREGGKW